MNVTTTTLGFQKLAGFFYSGLGATYTTTVTPGTGVIENFNVLKRPVSSVTSSIIGNGGASGTVIYTENSDIEFELEVWGNVVTVGTFTIISSSTGAGQGSMLASYATDSLGNITGIVNPSNNNVVPIGGLRTTPVRVVSFGDSTALIGNTQTASNQDISKVIATTWNTGLTNTAFAANKYLLGALYPQAYPVGNGGISGQTTTQMLARDSLAVSVTRMSITDMLDLSPNVVLLRAGSINDITIVTSGNIDATVAATYANHIEIINRFISRDVKVIDSGIYGFSGTATDTAQTKLALLRLNALYKAFAQANPTKIKFIDPIEAGLSDATGTYASDNTYDGTHLSAYGQYQSAKAEAKAMSEFFGQSSNTRYQGYNNLANSLMTSTGAVGWGTQATNYSSQTALATRQNAKVEYINGKQFQTCEFLITSSGATGTIAITFDPSSVGAGLIAPLNIINGDIYGFEYDFYVEPLNGMSMTGAIYAARVDIKDNIGSGRVLIDMMTVNTVWTQPSTMTGHISFPPIVFGDAQANLLNTTLFTFMAGCTNATGTFKVGVGNARCVKLNQPVLTT